MIKKRKKMLIYNKLFVYLHMDKSKRNKNAGKHPSYNKRKMTKASILKKRRRDKAAGATSGAKLHRAECNKARRAAKRAGKNVKGKDASHTKRGIVFKSVKSNRGSKSDSAGDKRARGKKS